MRSRGRGQAGILLRSTASCSVGAVYGDTACGFCYAVTPAVLYKGSNTRIPALGL